MKVLITGTAGFVGFHLAERLIKEGYEVVGLDVINDYYDVNLKYACHKQHGIDCKDFRKQDEGNEGESPTSKLPTPNTKL